MINSQVIWISVKYAITALIVVTVSEVSKYFNRIGALLVALPIVTVMTLIWLHVEGEEREKISNHAFYTCWYVIPTLPFFAVFPFLYGPLNFFWSLIVVCVMTIVLFRAFAWYMTRWDITLL